MRTSAPLSTCSGSASSLPRQRTCPSQSLLCRDSWYKAQHLGKVWGVCGPSRKGLLSLAYCTATAATESDTSLLFLSSLPDSHQKPLRGWHSVWDQALSYKEHHCPPVPGPTPHFPSTRPSMAPHVLQPPRFLVLIAVLNPGT